MIQIHLFGSKQMDYFFEMFVLTYCSFNFILNTDFRDSKDFFWGWGMFFCFIGIVCLSFFVTLQRIWFLVVRKFGAELRWERSEILRHYPML